MLSGLLPFARSTLMPIFSFANARRTSEVEKPFATFRILTLGSAVAKRTRHTRWQCRHQQPTKRGERVKCLSFPSTLLCSHPTDPLQSGPWAHRCCTVTFRRWPFSMCSDRTLILVGLGTYTSSSTSFIPSRTQFFDLHFTQKNCFYSTTTSRTQKGNATIASILHLAVIELLQDFIYIYIYMYIYYFCFFSKFTCTHFHHCN
jgi:hypothetical protein